MLAGAQLRPLELSACPFGPAVGSHLVTALDVLVHSVVGNHLDSIERFHIPSKKSTTCFAELLCCNQDVIHVEVQCLPGSVGVDGVFQVHGAA